jgi:DNA-binding transcriptional LysR family regulator
VRSIHPDHLRALAEVVATGRFAAAARKLNLSQPAVSLQIKELETRLGVMLVERMGKRAFPTPAGAELLDHAVRLEREMGAALDAMRRHREGWLGRVRIGTSEAILTYLLPPVLREVRRLHPSIELTAMAGSTRRVVDRILANELDLGLVTLPIDEPLIEAEFVREDPFVAVLPPDSEGVPDSVTPAFLAGGPFIMDGRHTQTNRLITAWFRTAGLDPVPAMEIDNSEGIKSMVAAGLGTSILPREAVLGAAAHREVLVRPLDPPLLRGVAMVRRRDKPRTTALDIVADALRSLARRELGAAAVPLRRRRR